MKKNREKTSVCLKKVLNQLSFLILLACSLLISPQIKAANSIFEQDYQLQLSFENAPLERVLDAITEQSGVKIVYSSDVVDASRKVTVNIKTSDILVALQSVFGKDYSFKQIEDYIEYVKLIKFFVDIAKSYDFNIEIKHTCISSIVITTAAQQLKNTN